MITPAGRHRRGTSPRPASPAWVLVDQAVNSVSNVGATILVAGAVPGRVFAVFATGQLILALGQTVMLAAASDRLLQAAPECRPARHAAGLAFYRRGMLVGLALMVPAAFVGGAGAYLAAAAVATVACGLDYVRTSLITAGRVRAAIAADSTFAVLQLGGLAVWAAAGAPGAGLGAWGVWGAAALVVLLPFALGLARAFPAAAPERLREAVSVRYGVEMAAVNGSGQIAQLVASTTIGLALNGMLRGAQIPFGVVVLALMAARVVLIPAFARPGSTRLFTVAVAGVVGLCAATGVVTWAVSALPATRFLVAGQQLDLLFVALTSATYAGIGVQLIVFYLLRARHDDRAVGVSRVVVVAGFALTALWAGATRSVEAFLVGSTLTWLAAVAVMLWTHRTHGAGATGTAMLDDGVVTAPGVPGPGVPSSAVAA